MNKLSLIIRREYLTRIQKRSFLIMTIITPFLLYAVIILPAIFFVDGATSAQSILVIGDSSGYYTRALNLNTDYEFINATEEYLSSANQDDEIYASIVLPHDLAFHPAEVSILSGSVLPKSLQEHIEGSLSHSATLMRIARTIGKEDSIEELRVNISAKYSTTTENDKSEVSNILSLLMAFGIYLFIFSYGTMIMRSVTEEKTNKIMEVMFLSAKPSSFILGKIIGVALVGLTQFACWGIMLFTFIYLNGEGGRLAWALSALPATLGMVSLALFFLIFFILGYLLYASFFAAVGAASDPNTDTHQFLLPITLPILFSIYAGLYASFHPDSALAFWCSYIPFTSPVVMMVRLCFGINPGEAIFSILLLLVAVALSLTFSAKIYSKTILNKGKSSKWI